MIETISWLGHSSIRLQGAPLIYINPFRVVRGSFHPDALLLGHHYHEQFSLADIQKLRGPNTQIICNARIARELPDQDRVTVLRPWQTVAVDRAGIKAVPAYTESGGTYTREEGGLGFVISLNYYDIYYAGSTGLIPEMDAIKPDLAILPIDGREGTLTVDDAVKATERLRPRWVIPCNYSGDSTTESQMILRVFKSAAEKYAEVVILPITR